MRGGALVVHPDGDIIAINLKPGLSHLPLMREHLGCSRTTMLRLTATLVMWAGEDGMNCESATQPANHMATLLARRHGRTACNLHGPALLCSGNQQGNSADLRADQLTALLSHLEDLAYQI